VNHSSTTHFCETCFVSNVSSRPVRLYSRLYSTWYQLLLQCSIPSRGAWPDLLQMRFREYEWYCTMYVSERREILTQRPQKNPSGLQCGFWVEIRISWVGPTLNSWKFMIHSRIIRWCRVTILNERLNSGNDVKSTNYTPDGSH
jgi:hypothetical protein